MRERLIAGLMVLVFMQASEAAAWAVDRGHLQMFSAVTASSAKQRFDDAGAPSGNLFFNKLLVQNWMEYGLTDAVTLFAAPEYIAAETDMDHRGVMRIHSRSVEAGVRVLLLSRVGMLSFQTSGKAAGAFAMSTATDDDAGKQWELRLLYGGSFKLFGHDAFFDIQAAKRWIGHPRPNELVFDATSGFWLTNKRMIMFQSFNMMSSGEAQPPYESYRLHKLQVSLVQCITSRWALQGGYFFAQSGRNSVKEQGFVAAVWYRS